MKKKKWKVDKKECYEALICLMEKGMNVNQAKQEYMNQTGLPEYVVREAYYSVRRQLFPELRRTHSRAQAQPEVQEQQFVAAAAGYTPFLIHDSSRAMYSEVANVEHVADGDEVLTCLSNIINLGDQAGIDISGFFGGIYPVFQLASLGATYKERAAKVNKIFDENQEIRLQLEIEQQKVTQLKKQVSDMKEYIKDLDEICETFLKLSGSQKIVKLADLTTELRYVIDKSGIVESVQRIEAQ